MTPSQFASLRALAERYLTEQWRGNDDVVLAEGVIALIDEVERLREERDTCLIARMRGMGK